MTVRHSIFGALLALGLLASTANAQGIYRWTDEDGRVHFGNSPPPGRDAVEQKLPPPKVREPAADDELADSTATRPHDLDEDGKPHDPDTPVGPSEAELDPDQGADARPLGEWDDLLSQLGRR